MLLNTRCSPKREEIEGERGFWPGPTNPEEQDGAQALAPAINTAALRRFLIPH